MLLKCKYQFQVFAFAPVIQETVIPDPLETGRQNMHQIPPDELGIIQGNCPARSTGLFPSGRKSDLLFIDREDTAVGYGNLMCISAEIFNGITKPVKGLFDVRAPILFVKAITETGPFIRILQFFAGSREAQLSIFEE